MSSLPSSFDRIAAVGRESDRNGNLHVLIPVEAVDLYLSQQQSALEVGRVGEQFGIVINSHGVTHDAHLAFSTQAIRVTPQTVGELIHTTREALRVDPEDDPATNPTTFEPFASVRSDFPEDGSFNVVVHQHNVDIALTRQHTTVTFGKIGDRGLGIIVDSYGDSPDDNSAFSTHDIRLELHDVGQFLHATQQAFRVEPSIDDEC